MAEPRDRLEQSVSSRLRAKRDELAREWLHRLLGRMNSSQHATLPVRHLMDVFSEAVDWLAECATGKAIDPGDLEDQLGETVVLQRRRGRTASEVLDDLNLFSDVVLDVVQDVVAEHDEAVPAGEVVEVVRHLQRGLCTMQMVVLRAFDEAASVQLREVRGRAEEFVRTLTHELKNPLGAAEIAAQMLMDGEGLETPADRARYGEMIVRNLRRGRELLGDLRNRAMPEMQAEGTDAWVGLSRVLSDVAQEVLPTAQEQGIRVHFGPVPDGLEVPGREAKLVLMNLAWNAVRYSDPEKHHRQVRVGVEPGEVGGVWMVRVQDNGIGIPSELHDRVFERLFRADPDKPNGTGLGLAIAREAAEDAGGGVWLESSEPGVGSTFVAAFPVRV